MSQSALAELKIQLAGQLVSTEQVTARPGLASGWPSLDQFLLWQGLPKGALSLFYGPSGLGATSLWLQCANLVTRNHRRVAWFENDKHRLCPWPLIKQGLSLKQLLVIRPRSPDSSLWALQEALSSSLFDLIGFDVTGLSLRESQIVKLRQLAQRSSTALVLIHSPAQSRSPSLSRSPSPRHSQSDSLARGETPPPSAPQSQLPALSVAHALSPSSNLLSDFLLLKPSLPRLLQSSAFHLVLRFDHHHVCVERALHRPPHHLFPRKEFYAHPMP